MSLTLQAPAEWLPLDSNSITGHNWSVTFPEDDFLCLRIPTQTIKPFDHPNILKSYPERYECKDDGRWRQINGHTIVIVLPKANILLRNSTHFGFVSIKVGDRKYTLNVSGGTQPNLHWIDHVNHGASLAIQTSKTPILNLLNHAAPYQESFQKWIPLSPQEIQQAKDTFLQSHKHDYLVIAAFGDWADDVPAGMVACKATLGGVYPAYNTPTPPTRWFLVPESEYKLRYSNPTQQFVINPQIHTEIRAIQ